MVGVDAPDTGMNLVELLPLPDLACGGSWTVASRRSLLLDGQPASNQKLRRWNG